MSDNGNGHGVRGSQRDDIQQARALDFNVEMHKSITAAKDLPGMVETVSPLWVVFRTFQQQQFEQEGLLSHVATQTEVGISIGRGNDFKLDELKKMLLEERKNARASQPLLDADASGAHRSQAGDVTAVQQQLERERLEAKNDAYALTTAINKINEAIGEEPQPGAEDAKKRKGSGMRRQIAVLFNLRSMALLVVAAFVGGGVLSVVAAELFKSYLLPLLLKGHV